MKTFNRVSVVALAAAFVFGLSGVSMAHAATSPTLTGASGYSVLGGAAITNVGTTTMNGAIGVSPGSSITGGTITAGGGTPPNDPVGAAAAQADRLSAFGALNAGTNADANCMPDFGFGGGVIDLAGRNLVPGVYCADSFTLTGTLNLSGSSGVWVFKAATTLVTSSASSVTGGDACNVWWRIGSAATLGTTTSFLGNIVTDDDGDTTALQTGATLNGRVLGGTGQTVTLAGNTITGPTCAGGGGSGDVNIRVVKTASDYTLRSGPKSVTFTYKVTNPGEVALSDVKVKDDKCDSVDYVSGDDNNNDLLDITEEWKYTCKKTVRETETNIVTAKGTGNGEEVRDTDTAKVTVSTPGLPATGVGPADGSSASWNVIVPTSIFAVLFSFYFVRKKLAM